MCELVRKASDPAQTPVDTGPAAAAGPRWHPHVVSPSVTVADRARSRPAGRMRHIPTYAAYPETEAKTIPHAYITPRPTHRASSPRALIGISQYEAGKPMISSAVLSTYTLTLF